MDFVIFYDNFCVQERYPVFGVGHCEFDAGVYCVEVVYKSKEGFFSVWPDEKEVVYESHICDRLEGVRVDEVLLELFHEKVGKSWGYLCAHGRTFDL